ncbi:hypothetical protein [Paenibacillus apiarius]|uniref:hypothetical protein n=1 Tax=Paenibacillus apiarius TaxID=46240 RepID=UPI0019820215|nr:hypothetical protein [Paenibacillus apiarius]MBN3525060.1 hypothetical protein [Paenibacillus apiarius]
MVITIFPTKYAFVYTNQESNPDTFRFGSHDEEVSRWKNKDDYNTFDSVLGIICREQLDILTVGMNVISEDGIIWILLEGSEFNGENHTVLEELFCNSIRKCMVTDKKLVSSLFTEDFSDNLLEISIERHDYYEVLPNNFYYGSQLNYSSEYESIINEDGVEIMSFKLQPHNSDSTITFINENLIEFSQFSHETEMRNQICALSALFNKTIKG